MRLVLVVDSPLTSRDRERYQVDWLVKSGFDVAVWDIHALVLPRSDAPELDVDGLSYLEFVSVAQLTSATAELVCADVIVLLSGMERGAETRYHDVRELVLHCDARVGAVYAGTRPVEDVDPRLATAWGRILRVAGEVKAGRVSLSYLVRRLRHLTFINRVKATPNRPVLDWAWTGPDPSVIDPSVVGPQTHFRALHTWDFDNELRHPVERTPRAGVVLIESMGPTHPDFSVLGIPTYVAADQWFADVRAWLAHLSEDLDERVTIAAHPRAQAGSLDRSYKPFDVIYGDSGSLVANARLVVAAEPSTALGWCALYGTPVALLRVADLYPGHLQQLQAYSRELGVPIIDNQEALLDAVQHDDLNPDPGFVSEYMAADEAPRVPLWETIATDIKR